MRLAYVSAIGMRTHGVNQAREDCMWSDFAMKETTLQFLQVPETIGDVRRWTKY